MKNQNIILAAACGVFFLAGICAGVLITLTLINPTLKP